MLLLANAYSTCPLGTLPHSAALSAPKRLAQALQTLSQSLQSTEEPLLVFKRSGNQRLQTASESLYSSTKADKNIASLVDKLMLNPDQSSGMTPLAEFVNIARCSDSLHELSLQSSADLEPLPRFK
ncbi:hypothetical protein PtB15_1B602 [Puccinia triticina]|nr:hypothetical protein PtB15_1B602 [Puccinia triticina]